MGVRMFLFHYSLIVGGISKMRIVMLFKSTEKALHLLKNGEFGVILFNNC
jgi:hypothetical protein